LGASASRAGGCGAAGERSDMEIGLGRKKLGSDGANELYANDTRRPFRVKEKCITPHDRQD